jgi:hypothetical protein
MATNRARESLSNELYGFVYVAQNSGRPKRSVVLIGRRAFLSSVPLGISTFPAPTIVARQAYGDVGSALPSRAALALYSYITLSFEI